MRGTKRAVQSHLLVIILTSLVATVLLILILPAVHENDHERCESIELKVIKACSEPTQVVFMVRNIANSKIFFREGETINTASKLGPDEQKEIKIPIEGSSVTLTPVIQYINNYYSCSTKKIKKRVSTLRKC